MNVLVSIHSDAAMTRQRCFPLLGTTTYREEKYHDCYSNIHGNEDKGMIITTLYEAGDRGGFDRLIGYLSYMLTSLSGQTRDIVLFEPSVISARTHELPCMANHRVTVTDAGP